VEPAAVKRTLASHSDQAAAALLSQRNTGEPLLLIGDVRQRPPRRGRAEISVMQEKALCARPPRSDAITRSDLRLLRISALTSAGSRRPCRKEPHRCARSHPTDVRSARTRWHRARCRPCLPEQEQPPAHWRGYHFSFRRLYRSPSPFDRQRP